MIDLNIFKRPPKNWIGFFSLLCIIFYGILYATNEIIDKIIETVFGVHSPSYVFIVLLLFSAILLLIYFHLFLSNKYYNEGVIKGLSAGEKVGYEKGKDFGIENSKKELFRNNEDTLSPLIEESIRFLSHTNNNKLRNNYIKDLAKKPDAINIYLKESVPNVEYPLWEDLTDVYLKTYNKGYDDFVRGVSPDLDGEKILLSNFRIYAQCVAEILNQLVTKEYNKDIIVWTFLDKPIWQWYNMILVSDGKTYVTEKFWENYKEQMRNIKNQNKIQFNRLTHKDEYIEKKNLFYHKDLLMIKNINNLFNKYDQNKLNNCHFINKYDNLANTDYNKYSYYIMYTGEKPIDDNWKNLIEDFEDLYHTRVVNGNTPIYSEKGCFLKYISDVKRVGVNYSYVKHYNDIFIVQSNLNPSHDVYNGFGIALKKDMSNDIIGVKLLTQNEVFYTLDWLKREWEKE